MAVRSAARAAACFKPKTYRYVKRLLDLGISLLVTAVGAIPVAMTCMVIRLESTGAPLLRLDRVGRDGVPFGMYKLRTMYEDAEERIEGYLTPDQLAEWEAEHKVDDDPRITKVGRFLRKTSLDEFPQFLNVILGDMSIVGPRPVTEEELERYGDDVDTVLSVRPGVTGYWQAFARNDATWESGERQEMEMHYVLHITPAFDARIILKTFGAISGLTGK